jgi:hypothetical protein
MAAEQWKKTIREAVVAAMADQPVGTTMVIDKIEVRKKNPIHEYRVVLGTNP